MSNRYLIGRRQFLITSSAAAVAAATVGPHLFASAGSPKRLAVGYATLDGDGVVRGASSIAAADGGFIGRGARITVASGRIAADPRKQRAVELVAHYPYLDGAERKVAPFRAWASSRLTGAKGSPTSFTMPVDEVQKLSFVVAAETGTPHAAPASRRDALLIEPTTNTPLPLVFSLQNEDGTIRLARGFYVVVPLFENDGEPRWTGLSVRTEAGFATLVEAEDKPASLEHFLLKIDYAG